VQVRLNVFLAYSVWCAVFRCLTVMCVWYGHLWPKNVVKLLRSINELHCGGTAYNIVRQVNATGYLNTERLMVFGETVAVYCENHTKHTDTFCGQNAEFSCVKVGGKVKM
jgi:hypothetical protein